MAITRSPLIHQDRVVFAITRINPELHQLGARLAWAAGQVEDGPLFRMRAPRRDHHDLQGQHAALPSPSVLEHVVDAAAELLLDVADVARRQGHAGLGCRRRSRLGSRERSRQHRDAGKDPDQLFH